MKKLLKISLWVTGIANVLFFAFGLVQGLLSSHMQSYYKAQLDDFTKSAEDLLAKKREWAEFGETQFIPESIGAIFFFGFVLLALIALILYFVQRIDKTRRNK